MLDTYDADRMPEQARARLKHELSSALAPLQDESGRLQTGWGLRLVQATAA